MSKRRRGKRVRRQGIPKRWAVDSINTGHSVDWRGMRPKVSTEPATVVHIISKERQAVMDRRARLINGMDVTYDSHIKLTKQLSLYFSNNYTKWFFIEDHAHLSKKSVVYRSREIAMLAYRVGINWLEVFEETTNGDSDVSGMRKE